MHRLDLAIRVLILLLPCACARTAGGEGDHSSAGPAASADSLAVQQADSAIHVMVTLRRDSLRLEVSQTPQQVSAQIDSALARVRQSIEFDVLAISPAILAANVRPRAPMSVADLVLRLRAHPLVAAAEPSGVIRVP